MTIINSEYELSQKIKKAEEDIKMGRVYTFKEVYEHLYSNKSEKKVCMK
ncbi:MAG: hypothetical protein Q8K30_00830 [Candidatus Gracilibacteria bacterium]|nr:hypothetical protein [Candidatus Gracilibacteria bacterium]